MKDGAPKYVTAVSHSDVVDGWRERRHEGGILIDVENDRIAHFEPVNNLLERGEISHRFTVDSFNQIAAREYWA
ncbi:MAG: TIGR03032 family protein, partial [Methyloceanibacter sp.]|nr:TIGR03032 family protein [Methyloceanibacter sp.]